MPLQIRPIKASKRKILPGLNEPYYKSAQKSRQKKASTVKGRSQLVNPQAARKIARQRQGRLIERGEFDTWANKPNSNTGESLKKGIEGMAVRAGLTVDDAELYYKLTHLDPDKLEVMYRNNDLIFEVAFNYGGASSDTAMDQRGAIGVIPGKKSELEFLVNQYEKAFGPIL